MELDSCFTCGKVVLNDGALYCSNECKNADGNSQSSKQITPPLNLHFSITIPPNIFKASDSNAKVSSPSSMSSSYSESSSFASLLDQNFNDKYNYIYNHCCDNFDDDNSIDIDNSDHYTSCYSTSNPIDIPSPRTQAANDLEPNKGTFGKEKSVLENSIF